MAGLPSGGEGQKFFHPWPSYTAQISVASSKNINLVKLQVTKIEIYLYPWVM